MADSYQRITALRPSDDQEHLFYECDPNYYVHAIVSVVNQTDSQLEYSIAHCPSSQKGLNALLSHWRAFKVVIEPNSPPHEISVRMRGDESIRVQASIANGASFLMTGLKYSGGDVAGYLATAMPSDTIESLLYACPAGFNIQGSISVSNQSDSAALYSIAICDNIHGDNPANPEDWRCYSVEVEPGSPPHEVSINLKAGESIRVKSSVANSFNFLATGIQIELGES